MSSQYRIGEKIKNSIALIYTKLNYPKARLIRLPVYIRRKKYLEINKGFTTGYSCRIEMFENEKKEKKIILGENCKIGDNVHIAAMERVEIGDNVLIASHVYISDVTHGTYGETEECSKPDESPDKRKLFTKPVKIGKNVWIGENVCVLPGVEIGEGAVIGANSVVNRNIEPYSIAVGAPARVVKKYNYQTKKWEKV